MTAISSSSTKFNQDFRESACPVDLTPCRELIFKYIKGKYRTELLISNNNKEDVVLFQIRNNAVGNYCVGTTLGLLNPNAEKRIEIIMPIKEKIADCAKNMFMVRAFVYDGAYIENDHETVKKVFEEHERLGEVIPNIKIKVYFEINDIVEKELATSRANALKQISRQTTNVTSNPEIEDPNLKTPSPYSKNLREGKVVSQIMRRVSSVSRVLHGATLRDQSALDQDDSYDFQDKVRDRSGTPSRLTSPYKPRAGEMSSVVISPFKENTEMASQALKGSIIMNRDSPNTSPKTKKSVSINKEETTFNLMVQNSKASRLADNQSSRFRSRIIEEDSTANLYENACDNSFCQDREVEIYRRQLQVCLKKLIENKKAIKSDEDEIKRMKTEMNILKLSGFSFKQKEALIKPVRESYKLEMWHYMMICIVFLILGSSMK